MSDVGQNRERQRFSKGVKERNLHPVKKKTLMWKIIELFRMIHRNDIYIIYNVGKRSHENTEQC